jgi:hypothetical protein
MNITRRRNNLIRTMFLGLILLLAIPAVSLAQGRGYGRGRGRGPDLDKKCGKFVNCHDARDGRWDGRGPRSRGIRVGDIFRNRRNRRIYRDDDIIFRRTRRVDRDGDGDFDRNDVRLGRRVRRNGRWRY